MKIVLAIILCLSFSAGSFAKGEKGLWKVTMFKPSLKADCMRICGLEISLDDQMIVTDIIVQGNNPFNLSEHSEKIVNAALRSQGFDDVKLADILNEATIVKEYEK